MKVPYRLTMRGLVKNKKNILLLKRHPNSKTNPNKWELPGGTVFKFPNQNLKNDICI